MIPILTSPAGLGGSCLNILLYGIYCSNPSLTKAILDAKCDSENSPFSLAIQKIFKQLEKNAANSTIDTSEVWDLIGHDKLETIDARELFLAMVDLFDQEIPGAPSEASFGYTVDNEIASIASHARREDKIQDELLLGLSVTNGAQDIATLLTDHFGVEELLVEKGLGYAFAENDYEPEDAEKGIILASLPKDSFVIQLQRFSFDIYLKMMTKIDDKISFPKKMSGPSLSKLCCRSNDPYHKTASDRVSSVKELFITSIVIHASDSGYSGYFLWPTSGEWFHLSVSGAVEASTEKDALSAGYGDGSHGSESAYLLFYKVNNGGGNESGAMSGKLSKLKADHVSSKSLSMSSSTKSTSTISNEKEGHLSTISVSMTPESPAFKGPTIEKPLIAGSLSNDAHAQNSSASSGCCVIS